MDRVAQAGWGEKGGPTLAEPSGSLLPSRQHALRTLVALLEAPTGPILLTGESGAGKSWLASDLPRRLGHDWRMAAVDLSAALSPEGLYPLALRHFGHGRTEADVARERGLLEDCLLEAAENGERWLLVGDDAHTASDALLEEIRLLTNRIGQPGGFAGVLIVGQPALSLRLARRPLEGLGRRLAGHVHLRPPRFEEVLAAWADPGSATPASIARLERLYRETRGNPRRILPRLALTSDERPVAVHELPQPAPEPISYEPVMDSTAEKPPVDLPTAVPTRPPLTVSDSMIEVGWDAASAAALDESGDSSPAESATGGLLLEALGPRGDRVRSRPTGKGGASVELVEDHYAALQAWNEWTRNQGRTAVEPNADTSTLEPDSELDEEDLEQGDEAGDHPPATATTGHADVRVEPQHGFAPYSQLFSRLRESRDSA